MWKAWEDQDASMSKIRVGQQKQRKRSRTERASGGAQPQPLQTPISMASVPYHHSPDLGVLSVAR